jgi:hypothetical protein
MQRMVSRAVGASLFAVAGICRSVSPSAGAAVMVSNRYFLRMGDAPVPGRANQPVDAGGPPGYKHVANIAFTITHDSMASGPASGVGRVPPIADRQRSAKGLNRSRGMHSVSTWWFFIGNPLGFLC